MLVATAFLKTLVLGVCRSCWLTPNMVFTPWLIVAKTTQQCRTIAFYFCGPVIVVLKVQNCNFPSAVLALDTDYPLTLNQASVTSGQA